MKLVPNILKKAGKISVPKPAVIQENKALLTERLKDLDTFVSTQAPKVKTSQTEALSKIDELAKAVAKTMPKK